MAKQHVFQKININWENNDPDISITTSDRGNKNSKQFYMLTQNLVVGYLDKEDQLDEVEILEAMICELAFKN